MPMLYCIDDNGQIYFASKLDTTQKKQTAGLSAMLKFQSLDRQARTENSDSILHSIHQNAITCVRKMSDTDYVRHCSTTSLDGQLVVWDLKVCIFFWRQLFRIVFHILDVFSAPGKLHRRSQDCLNECSSPSRRRNMDYKLMLKQTFPGFQVPTLCIFFNSCCLKSQQRRNLRM